MLARAYLKALMAASINSYCHQECPCRLCFTKAGVCPCFVDLMTKDAIHSRRCICNVEHAIAREFVLSQPASDYIMFKRKQLHSC